MNDRFKLLSLSLVLLVFLISALSAQEETEIRTIYQKAKLKCVSHEWPSAINLFKELLDKYPASKYVDDAYFWIAYSLEKDPMQKPKAFQAFSRLISKYPESPYVDDALGFQIDLAEQLVISGNEEYRTFLYGELKKDVSDLQYRAALALGRIGDPAALPVLEKMEENEDYGKLAKSLTALLEANRLSVERPQPAGEEADPDAVYKGSKVESSDSKDKTFLWFDTARYEQYQSMLKNNEDWSESELRAFALWHILPTGEFKTYINLTSKAAKKEWLRKYWKRNDPTPTSPENEREEEFNRRVKNARENFSALWEFSEFKYMPDQFLRPDWPHAPWDARGELYIKYGEPDARSSQGWQMEVWTYYRYGIDFLVRSYMTNIYGNAIHAGEMAVRQHNLQGNKTNESSPFFSTSQRAFGKWNSLDSFMQANFIYKNEMRYEYNYQANPISNLKLSLETKKIGEKKNLIYHYQIPAGEFEMIKKAGVYEVRFREVFCVLDEELHEVARHDIIRNIGKIPDDDYQLKETIKFNLPAGKYTFYLRLEDLNERNLGVFSQQFEVTKT